jgi:hypothetical protein
VLLLAAALALLVLGVAALGVFSLPQAAEKGGKAATEADRTLQDLMKYRDSVKGTTARGQTLADAPPFKVVPRKPALKYYPCTGCHDNTFVDNRVRQLKDEHPDLVFDHGGGRFWCYDACHNGRDMDHLTSLRKRPIDYDASYELCGQCHFERQKDWAFGGHGRRAGAWPVPAKVPLSHEDLRVAEREKIGTWSGERVILGCPACHNPHSPAIRPFQPSPAPLMRSGLPRTKPPEEAHFRSWERPAFKGEGKQ